MATIAASKITDLGLAGSMTTCAEGGDEFANTGIEFIRIQNSHATQGYTVKVKAQTQAYKHPTYGNLTKDHVYIALANVSSGLGSSSAYIGPFKQGSFSNATNKVQVFYKDGSVLSDTAFDAAANIGTGSHLLKIEVLYLEN